MNYKAYTIHSTCGRNPLWYVSKNGQDLFYGIESLQAAKDIVDSMTFLSTVKWS